MYGCNWRSDDYAMSMLRVFDKEVRKLACVVPGADCMAGDNEYTSWFMADFNVGDQLFVLTYDKWSDGLYYWNLQRNDYDIDGPEGIVDMCRYKYFGAMVNYISELVKCDKTLLRL